MNRLQLAHTLADQHTHERQNTASSHALVANTFAVGVLAQKSDRVNEPKSLTMPVLDNGRSLTIQSPGPATLLPSRPIVTLSTPHDLMMVSVICSSEISQEST